MKFCILLAASVLTALGMPGAAAQGVHDERRRAMLDEIRETVRETATFLGKDQLDESVMAAVGKVPRHEFVPEGMRDFAYANRPLPIGAGQTISQPYIVALMTDLASIGPSSKVLEIGTGSGYQAAVLAEIAEHVYTIEIIPELGRAAEATLRRLGYDNVSVRIGDGWHGWPGEAPFDAILVTAAPEVIPAPLLRQLRPGGRLVIPVGDMGGVQSLQVVTRHADGSIETRDVLPVGFVPFTGPGADAKEDGGG
jgi:protein-L-isoaspartate(D-aspartate) O-methyltransferase